MKGALVLGGGGGIEDLEREGEQQEGKEDGIGGEPALQISRGVFFGEKRNLFFDRLNSGTGALPLSRGTREGVSTIRSWTDPNRRRLFPTRGNHPQLLD